VRRSVHFGLSTLLAIVSISAPFSHTHDSTVSEEHLEQEQFSVLHAHIPLPSEDAALQQVDNSARRVNWYHFEHEKAIALAVPTETSEPALETPERAGWLEDSGLDVEPEESPPRAVHTRGPPSLFA
jgi:hypothetical protein